MISKGREPADKYERFRTTLEMRGIVLERVGAKKKTRSTSNDITAFMKEKNMDSLNMTEQLKARKLLKASLVTPNSTSAPEAPPPSPSPAPPKNESATITAYMLEHGMDIKDRNASAKAGRKPKKGATGIFIPTSTKQKLETAQTHNSC